MVPQGQVGGTKGASVGLNPPAKSGVAGQGVANAWHLERHYPREWGRWGHLDHHIFHERIAHKAREIAPQYSLDADALIERVRTLPTRSRTRTFLAGGMLLISL